MDLGIAGKVALVTAASKGLGRATAQALSEEGASVVICARGEDALKEAAAAMPGEVHAVVADVTWPEVPRQLVDRLDVVLVGEAGAGVDVGEPLRRGRGRADPQGDDGHQDRESRAAPAKDQEERCEEHEQSDLGHGEVGGSSGADQGVGLGHGEV